MKNIEKLPLSFEYLEKLKKKFDKEDLENTIYYLNSNKLQTKCLTRQNPSKSIVRML